MSDPSLPPPIPDKDEEHLNLLATFHYVVALLGALFACMPLIHVVIGVVMLTHPEAFEQGRDTVPAPPWVGYLFVGMGTVFIILGWIGAVCAFLSGRYLSKRKYRMFSFVMAAIMCMFVPFGTVLGVFTIIVLSRESVQRLYEEAKRRQEGLPR